MILCSVIGCELELKARAIVDELNGGNGRARCNAYMDFHERCSRCDRLKHWERLQDGTARTMLGPEEKASAA